MGRARHLHARRPVVRPHPGFADRVRAPGVSSAAPKDAFRLVDRLTARPWMAGLFAFVFLFPILGNVISRLTRKHGWWLNDYDALICGAHSVGLGQSPYSLNPMCDGLRPAPFVYAPQVGAFFAPLVDGLGFAGARWVYLIPLVPALLA